MINETLTRVGEALVCVDFIVDAAEVDAALADAEVVVRDLMKRPLGDKQTGGDPELAHRQAVAVRATRALVEKAVRNAVSRHDIRLAANPSKDIEVLVTPGMPFCFSIELQTVPEYGLSSIEDLVVELPAVASVTEEDVCARLEEIRGRCAEVKKDSDLPISMNDIVELSFESFLDGEPYEGSTVSGYTYTVGSQHLPALFEEGLVGMVSGQEKTIEFDVPEGYGNEEIEGKHARFDVRIGRVASCTLPDVDDAFAQSFDYENLAAWKKKIAGELAREKEGEAELAKEKAARQVLADRLQGTVGEDMLDAHAEQMLQAFKQDLSRQGVNFAEYCSFLNLTEAAIKAEMKEEGRELLRENLALEALFRQIGLGPTDSDVQRTFDELADDSGSMRMPVDQLDPQQRLAVREMTMHRMATEWLMEHAVFVEG